MVYDPAVVPGGQRVVGAGVLAVVLACWLAPAHAEEPAAAPRSGPAPGSTLKVYGVISAGLGVLALGGGAYLGWHASNLADELSQPSTEPWTQEELDKQDEGRTANRFAILLTAVGIGGIVTGGVLYYLGRERDAAQPVSVQPAAGGGMTGLVVTGRF